MSEEQSDESRDMDGANPYQAAAELDEAGPEIRSAFMEFFPIPHFAIFMLFSVVLLFTPIVQWIGVVGLGTGVLAMLRSWFWVNRIGDARRKGFAYPTPASQTYLFSGSLAISLGVAIVWPIAFVAACFPMVYAFSFAGNGPVATAGYYWILVTVTGILFPIVVSTLLCTWILRATLPPLPNVNE